MRDLFSQCTWIYLCRVQDFKMGGGGDRMIESDSSV